MATVTYPEGGPAPFDIDDHDTTLAAYYTGEGAEVEHSDGRVFVDGAYPPVDEGVEPEVPVVESVLVPPSVDDVHEDDEQ